MLAPEQRLQLASQLMLDFAQRTGLTSERTKQRYLWTDAFAVCNFLGLASARSETRFMELALGLVDQVHHVLGRHRPDGARTGWISGLSGASAEAHPTRGGLRIGKPLPERSPSEAFDEQLEWERDGQYFHYLTRWMHALDQVARATGRAQYNVWARELAETAHRAFTHVGPAGTRPRLAWKMSVDLKRPLVAAMGHHDPLDGLVTCAQLRATAAALPGAPEQPNLERALADFAAMAAGQDWTTIDPLGLGGLLTDASRIAWLTAEDGFPDPTLLDSVLAAAADGLAIYARRREFEYAAAQRLAFRELGLAIGLHAVAIARAAIARSDVPARLGALAAFAPIGDAIESFWIDPDRRRTRSWLEHRDINDVMLATRLVPDGYARLGWSD